MLTFDNLLDVFNSTSKFSPKPYKCALTSESLHWEYLQEMDQLFSKLKCRYRNKKGVLTHSRPACIDGWRFAIAGITQLFHSLKDSGVTYLTTRSANQDPLENLFGMIRRQGGDEYNPTSRQFRDAIRYIMISACLDLHQPTTATNCEFDVAQVAPDSF